MVHLPSTQVTGSVLSPANGHVKFYEHPEVSSWVNEALNTSAPSNASRLSLTPLTETFVNGSDRDSSRTKLTHSLITYISS
jgi:hypothetical protein